MAGDIKKPKTEKDTKSVDEQISALSSKLDAQISAIDTLVSTLKQTRQSKSSKIDDNKVKMSEINLEKAALGLQRQTAEYARKLETQKREDERWARQKEVWERQRKAEEKADKKEYEDSYKESRTYKTGQAVKQNKGGFASSMAVSALSGGLINPAVVHHLGLDKVFGAAIGGIGKSLLRSRKSSDDDESTEKVSSKKSTKEGTRTSSAIESSKSDPVLKKMDQIIKLLGGKTEKTEAPQEKKKSLWESLKEKVGGVLKFVGAIAGIATTAWLIYENWEKIVDVGKKTIDVIKNSFDWITENLDSIKTGALVALGTTIAGFISKLAFGTTGIGNSLLRGASIVGAGINAFEAQKAFKEDRTADGVKHSIKSGLHGLSMIPGLRWAGAAGEVADVAGGWIGDKIGSFAHWATGGSSQEENKKRIEDSWKARQASLNAEPNTINSPGTLQAAATLGQSSNSDSTGQVGEKGMTEVTRKDISMRPGHDTPEISGNVNAMYTNIANPLQQALDTEYGPGKYKVKVSSTYRDPIYNASVGGATNSKHLTGNAMDLSVDGLSNETILALMDKHGIQYDKALKEKGKHSTWMHMEYFPGRAQRGQVASLNATTGKYVAEKSGIESTKIASSNDINATKIASAAASNNNSNSVGNTDQLDIFNPPSSNSGPSIANSTPTIVNNITNQQYDTPYPPSGDASRTMILV